MGTHIKNTLVPHNNNPCISAMRVERERDRERERERERERVRKKQSFPPI